MPESQNLGSPSMRKQMKKPAHIDVSLLEIHIDQIMDKQFYCPSNCRLKYFYGKKFSTTLILIAGKQQFVNQPSEKLKNIICCPDILNASVNIYPVCNNKDCKK